MEKNIDEAYLRSHPNEIFVFGDNLVREGYGGAASLRDLENAYGVITKKTPEHCPAAYYKPNDYERVFYKEMDKLIKIIKDNPDKKYLISRIGAGLANYFGIFEAVIKPKIRNILKDLPNVEFLWEDEEEDKLFFVYINLQGKLVINEATTEAEAKEKLEIIRKNKIALNAALPTVRAKTIEQVAEIFNNFSLG